MLFHSNLLKEWYFTRIFPYEWFPTQIFLMRGFPLESSPKRGLPLKASPMCGLPIRYSYMHGLSLKSSYMSGSHLAVCPHFNMRPKFGNKPPIVFWSKFDYMPPIGLWPKLDSMPPIDLWSTFSSILTFRLEAYIQQYAHISACGPHSVVYLHSAWGPHSTLCPPFGLWPKFGSTHIRPLDNQLFNNQPLDSHSLNSMLFNSKLTIRIIVCLTIKPAQTNVALTPKQYDE